VFVCVCTCVGLHHICMNLPLVAGWLTFGAATVGYVCVCVRVYGCVCMCMCLCLYLCVSVCVFVFMTNIYIYLELAASWRAHPALNM